MAQLFYEPLARVFTNTGAVGAGYKYYFYTTGTTTPISSYTTQALSTPNAYPVVADSNGRFPPIWLSNLATTKVVLTDSVGNVIETQDPIGATTSTTSLNDLDVRPTSYWGLTSGTSTAYVLTANPSISAYSNVQTFFFQPHIANGAAATIAISGLSALNLKKYTGQGTKVALQAGDLQATQRYIAICDGVDIIVLNPRSLPINSGVSASLTIAAGVIAVTNVGSSYSIDTEGASASDDLDTINGGADGDILYLRNTNDARNVVLKHATGNIWNPNLTNTTLDVTTDLVCLMYSSVLGYWVIQSSSVVSNFLNSKTTNGYTYLPNGFIEQWGTYTSTIPSGGSVDITLPVTFPNTFLNAICCPAAASYSGDGNALGTTKVSTSIIRINNGSLGAAGNSGAAWRAIGN